MGDWIRCPESLRPTLSGAITIDVGLREFGNTTFMQRTYAMLGPFTIDVQWTGSLLDTWSGDWPILLPPADPEGKFYDEFTVAILFSGDPDDPHLSWSGVGSVGVQKFYVCDSVANGESYPVVLPFTLTAAYRLWRQHNVTPPSTRGLRYWWDCAVADRWGLEADAPFTASVTGPAGGMSAEFLNADAETDEGGSYDSIAYYLGFVGSGGGQVGFAGHNGVYARIEAGLGGVGDPVLASEAEDFGDWHVTGDGSGVEASYDGEPASAAAPTWSFAGSLAAVVTPALAAYDTGGLEAESRTDPEIVITGLTPSRSQSISATDPFAVPGGTSLAVTVDEAWAADHNELAEVERQPDDDLPTANNLPIKLDVPPPSMGVGSPYWTGPASVGVWSALDVMLGTRLLADVGAVPWTSPSDTEQDVDLATFWAANKARWSETGGHVMTFDDLSHELLIEAASEDAIELARTISSGWRARQTQPGSPAIPECYRITRANYFGGDIEDFYDWNAFRYLALQLDADRFPLTITVEIDYSQPLVSDNHLTGSRRAEEYQVSYVPGTWTTAVAATEAGWYTLDLLGIDPAPRLVEALRVAIAGLQPGETVTLQTLGVSQDMPAVNRDEETLPDDRAWLKWLQIWDGSETIAVARVDGRPGLNVYDRLMRRHEVQGVPAIEWLWGAETGVDLSHALTMEHCLGLIAVQEGWRAAWDDDAWEDETTCVVDAVTRYLSDGYPWDVEWEAGTNLDASALFPMRSCIGARSWRLAGGLQYSLHGQWFARGRLDGLLVVGDASARNEAGGVTVDGDGLEVEVGSNAHGQWWSPAAPEAGGDPLAAYAYELQSGSADLAVARTGATEWVWVDRLDGPPLTAFSNGNVVRLRCGAWAITRGGYVHTREGYDAPWVPRVATSAPAPLLLRVWSTDVLTLLDTTPRKSITHGRTWVPGIAPGTPVAAGMWRNAGDLTEARMSRRDQIGLCVGTRSSDGAVTIVAGGMGRQIVTVATLAGEAVGGEPVYPWIHRLITGVWLVGAFVNGSYYEWRSEGLDELNFEQTELAAVGDHAKLANSSMWPLSSATEVVAGYHAGAGQMVVLARQGVDGEWQGPHLQIAADEAHPYVCESALGTIEVGWLLDGAWVQYEADKPAGPWSLR